MFEPFQSHPVDPRPDDTMQLPAAPSSRRPVLLMIAAGAVAVAVLVGIGFLAFGTLGSGPGGGGIQQPGLLPALPPSTDATAAAPSDTPTAQPTTTTVGAPPAIKLTIAKTSMQPPSYQGADCPGSTTAFATVVVKAPVTITYQWAVAALPGQAGGPATYTFPTAGSHVFSLPLTNIKLPAGQVQATFIVSAPVARSASTRYTQKCGASVSAITPIRQAPLACPVGLTATLTAGVGPMTVRYHWVINGTNREGNPPSPWRVPAGGGKLVVNINIKDALGSVPTKINADLVVESPVHTKTKSLTVTCTK
ncbi:MAG TPA: hypothetical protein VKB59_11290 [Micromonosporaceae bacterium]|nr:hypothetical protein [Micromonosporaceae bacterium]